MTIKHKRTYQPSETHLALYPPSNMILCKCGIRFQPRSESVDGQDDPELCLTCNRASWSRLWNDNKPIESKTVTTTENEIESADGHEIDSKANGVVPITRNRK